MAIDRYKAIVEAKIGDQTFTLQLTNGDVMAFEDELGVDWLQQLASTHRGRCRYLSAALIRHQPQMTPEWIAESGLPTNRFGEALTDCLTFLFNGPDEPKAKKGDTSKKAARGNGSKKLSASASTSTSSEALPHG